MATISIALATFNGEKYLEQQLDSLAAQSRPPDELIVSDDASHDRTLEIVRAFAARSRFRVHVEESKASIGYRGNFMRAVALCTGDLIAFCDQDDVWVADKLAVMERAFDDPDVLLAYHNATLIGASGKPYGRYYGGHSGSETFAPLTRDPWLVPLGLTQVFRRELTRFSELQAISRDVDWPDEPLAHDQWFAWLASVFGLTVFARRPLAQYRQHESNTFGAYPDVRARFFRLMRGESFLQPAAAAAANRAALLRHMRDDAPPQWRERAERGIAYYEGLQKRLEARTQIYAAPALTKRFAALRGLLLDGAYAGASGRFGWADLLKDLYLAVPFGPGLRRFLP